MQVEILKQLSVFMPNRPGALSALAKLFAESGINILGLASEVRDDSGLVRIAVSEKVDGSGILSKAGFASVETNVLAITAPDKPGELHRITRVLAEGKINITTVYGTTSDGQNARVLISVENVDKARRLLEAA